MNGRKKILVTGGAGFIGSHTVVELYNAGYEPVIIDNFSNSEEFIIERLKELTHNNILFFNADSTSRKEMKEVFLNQNISGAIHFAAFKAVGESVAKPLMYYRNNIDSLIVLLELMNEFNVKDLVFSSSCTVYGDPEKIPVSENSPSNNAMSPYGNTKVICEQLLRDVNKTEQVLRTIILRYFNPIGAHPSGLIGELPQGVPNNLVPYITQTAFGLREKLTIYGKDYNTPDGTCIRDFIHVVDLAKAHVAALKKLETENKPQSVHVYNLGTGSGHTVLDVIKTFERVNNIHVPHQFGPRRPGDVEQIWASTTLAEKELNWKTELTLEDALRDSWNWENKLRKNEA